MPNITKEEIDTLPLKAFDGEIHIIDSIDVLNKALPYLERQSLLGFDTETRPSFKKGWKNKVALLQLATNEHAFLIRVNKIGLPDQIVDLLTNTKITKAGVAIKQDLGELYQWRNFLAGGFVDIQKYSQDFGIEDNSLKKITAIVLGFRISKSSQLSNWEADVLSQQQAVYAATDAWTCYNIYRTLSNNEYNH